MYKKYRLVHRQVSRSRYNEFAVCKEGVWGCFVYLLSIEKAMNKEPETMSLAMRRKNENIQKSDFAKRIVKPYLEKEGYKFTEEKVCVYGDEKQYHYLADFYLPKPYYMIIEVDGPYHKETKQLLIDRYKDKYYTEVRRFRVLRVTNGFIACRLDKLKKHIEDLRKAQRSTIWRFSYRY